MLGLLNAVPVFLGLAVHVVAVSPEQREANHLHVPLCAVPCATNSAFGCSPTDLRCLCSNPNFVSSATSCIQSSCSGDDVQHALLAAERLCLDEGITLTAGIPFSTTTINGIPTTLFVPDGAWTASIPISTTTINGIPTTLFIPNNVWTTSIPITTATINGIPTTLYEPWTGTPTFNPWFPTTTTFPFAISSAAASARPAKEVLTFIIALTTIFYFCT